MNPNEVPLSLGAVESPKDKRDINLGSVQAPQTIPAVYRPAITSVPTYYQGRTPACGGHAGAYFKSLLDYLSTTVAEARSPRFVDTINKRDDGVPHEEGTFLRQIFATLKYVGACQLHLHPNSIDLPLPQYRNPALISAAAYADAALNKTGEYAFVRDLTFEGLKQAIYQNKAVILLIWVDSGFFRTAKPVFTNRSSGHFVVACQYDEDNIYVVDSTEQDPALALKAIHKSYIPFAVREATTAINLPRLLVKGLTSRNDIIRKLIELYIKLLPFYPAKVGSSTS
jgi:hypothetical protein